MQTISVTVHLKEDGIDHNGHYHEGTMEVANGMITVWCESGNAYHYPLDVVRYVREERECVAD
jgi:hypothetical protein